VVFAVYGLYLQEQRGPVLKYGVAVAMAVAPAAVNSLQWVVVQVAMLEKLLEWFLAKPIDYVQEAAAVALNHA
jgi:hypothetical protein